MSNKIISKRHLRRKIATRVQATMNKLSSDYVNNKGSQNISSSSSLTMSSGNQIEKDSNKDAIQSKDQFESKELDFGFSFELQSELPVPANSDDSNFTLICSKFKSAYRDRDYISENSSSAVKDTNKYSLPNIFTCCKEAGHHEIGSLTDGSVEKHFINLLINWALSFEISNICLDEIINMIKPMYTFLDNDYIKSSVNHDKSAMEFIHLLKDWACTHNITYSSFNDLIKLIKPKYPFLKNDCRSLLDTKIRKSNTIKLDNGELIYFGLETQLRKILFNYGTESNENYLIKLQINVDGIPIYKSSSVEFWPILGKSNDLMNKSPFPIAIFCGRGKPNLSKYLENFIDECLFLSKHGFFVDNKHYFIQLEIFCCDAPARAYLKQIKGHTSKFGCERCTIESLYEDKKHFYPSKTVSCDLRKSSDFLSIEGSSHIKERSPLLQLNINLVSQFILDPMHLIYLGVVKRLLLVWLEGVRPYKISKVSVSKINRRISEIRKFIPSEFSRKIRKLDEVKRFKATEFRFFLLYGGPVFLKDNINSDMYYHFLLLHTSIFILSNETLKDTLFHIAENFLIEFVEKCSEIYNKCFVTYNVHSLIHICDDVKLYGTLDKYSCFCFENYLGKLKRMIRGKNLPLQQIHRRLIEVENLKKRKSEISLPLAKGIRTIDENNFFCDKLETSQFNLSIGIPNNVVSVGKDIIVIKSFMFINNVFKFTGVPFKYYSDFYKLPVPSSKLGIYFVRGEGNLTLFHVNKINFKYLCIPHKDGYIAIPILHQSC